MTQKELIAAIAGNTKFTQVEAKELLTHLTLTITKTLSEGSEVAISDLGKFVPVLRKGKTGIIPGTTKKYTSQDSTAVKFKVAKAFKDSVAAGK